jgi:peptide methionine sulfoxide reductase MsrA
MSITFYHEQEQKELAEEKLREEAKKQSDPILTKTLPAATYYDAEEYVLLPEFLFVQILYIIMFPKF